MSYPGATHTRFSHSLGTMHVSGMYAAHLFGKNSPQYKLCRLAGLLHDVGHGPFSHQFDDVVFSALGYEEGHDQFRERLLLEKLPECMKENFDFSGATFKKSVMKEIEVIFGSVPKQPFKAVMEKVNNIFVGEKLGDPLFNIVQGPLGADRMDFVIRDAYFSGVRHYGTVPMNRIVRNSLIANRDDQKVLAYNLKVVDDIYTVLFGRFMMYKNVYFHKTSRAADMMIQELLRKAMKPLDFAGHLKDLDSFLQLSDDTVFEGMNLLYHQSIKSGKLTKDVREAHEIIQRLKRRDLWKLVVEIPFSATGIDPSTISRSLGDETLKKMKERLKEMIKDSKINSKDLEAAKELLKDFEDLFVVDTPYKLTLVHPDEFLSNRVYIQDSDERIMTFEEFEREYPTYKLMSGNMLQLVRIYIKKDFRDLIYRYSLIPKESIDMTTRW